MRRAVSRLIAGARGLLSKRRVETELDAEVRQYLDQVIERNVSDGLSLPDARRAARAEIGSLEAIKDGVRDVGWETALEHLWLDVRYAVRSLARSRGFAAVTVLTLALGIGANAAVFSVAHAIMLQPLPYADPERLAALVPAQKGQPGTQEPVSFPTFRDWQSQTASFASMAAYVVAGVTLTGLGETDSPITCALTSNAFSLLGVAPLLGRTLNPDDDRTNAGQVVVVSEQFWRERLGARRDAIGQRLTLDDAGFTIVGVMPAAFKFPNTTPSPQLWMPLVQFPSFRQLLDFRMAPFLSVVARLRSDRAWPAAQAEIDAVAERLRAEHPAILRQQIVRVAPLQEQVLGDARSSLFVLIGGVALLLVIACVNVAGLQIARTIARGRDLAVRTALGASRFRLARHILIESVLLAVLGGALGLFLAAGGLRLLTVQIGDELPQVRDVAVDRWVLGFTFVLSCAGGLLFGFFPVHGARRAGVSGNLREGARTAGADRRTNKVRNVLVVVEVALAMVMLTSAGLLARSLAHLRDAETGFDATGVLMGVINLPQSKYPNRDRWEAFNAELLERTRALPGVVDAAFGVGVPFLGVPVPLSIAVEGRHSDSSPTPTTESVTFVSDRFFRTLRIPVVEGREFARTDTRQAPRVAVVNQSFARRFFDKESPIGRKVIVDGPKGIAVEIVGVVGDTAQTSITAPRPALLYMPFAQRPFWLTSFALRASGDPRTLAGPFREAVASLSPDAPVLAAEPLTALIHRSFAGSSHRATILGLFSALAMTLAAVGIYGLVAYTVATRTNEIGVRMALGAERRHVQWLVLRQGLRLTIIGTALGVAISLGVSRLLATMLFGVGAADPVTFAVVCTLLLCAAAAACYLPARRATRIDPLTALRCE